MTLPAPTDDLPAATDSNDSEIVAIVPPHTVDPQAEDDAEACVADAPTDDASEQEQKRGALADTLASAVVVMFVLTVVQRGTGFLRSVFICRLLTPEDLGLWNMAKSLLVLAAPLIVLGLPGSLKRYLSYYREQGQLRLFLKRTLGATVVLTLLGITMSVIYRDELAWATFGTSSVGTMMIHLSITLLFVIAFNFTVELLTALRQVRVVSYLQLANSLIFTVVTLSVLMLTGMRAEGVVFGFGVANLVTAVIGTWAVWKALADEADDHATSPDNPTRIWSKLAPFAAWFWLADLLANLFGNVDRIMIVHFAEQNGMDGLSLVGQYHSSQIIGILLIGLAGILGGVLLSYLSHDWETGQREKAAQTLDFSVKLSAVALTIGSAFALILAPVVFNFMLDHKYDAGFDVLPMTMTYCIWLGLLGIAHNFLWCREKSWLVSVSWVIGLGCNIVFNYLWLPRWGLPGAVAATAAANLITLCVVFLMGQLLGMRYSLGTFVTVALPATLCFGGTASLVATAIVLAWGLKSNWLLTDIQRTQMDEKIRSVWNRAKQLQANFGAS